MAIFSELLRNIGTFPENEGAFRRLTEHYESAISIVPFVGAGLSIPYGFPSWTMFLRDQARYAGVESEVNTFLDALKYEEAADVVESSIGKQAFADAIEDAFGDHHLEDKEFAGSVNLISEFASGPVITTNFDHLLEKVFTKSSKAFESVVWGTRVDLMKKALSHNRRYLLKLHGDVDDRKDRILTLQEYRKAYSGGNRMLPRILKEIFSTRPVLFLGCSLSADRIVGILADIARESQLSSHYAIVEAPSDDSERRVRAKFLYDHSIKPIWYPAGRHELIFSLLELLIQQKTSRVSSGTEIAVAARIESRAGAMSSRAKNQYRRDVPTPRRAIAHTFSIAGYTGQIVVSFFEDDRPAELLLRMDKEGSTITGLLDCFAVTVSLGLQHGIPLKLYTSEFSHTRFEPSGFTGDREIPIAKSLTDYIFRWLELKVTQAAPGIEAAPMVDGSIPKRKDLPSESASVTHSFEVAGHNANLTVSTYPDGKPGAIHLRMYKEGSTFSGLIDVWCSAVSIALQHEVPLQTICDKISHTRFEPSGFTGNPEIPIAKSILDYVGRWLELRYLYSHASLLADLPQ